MTIDWTKPIQTRDGRKARVLCTDLLSKFWTVVVAIMDPGGEFEVVGSVTKDGRSTLLDHETGSDIINVTDSRTPSHPPAAPTAISDFPA